MTTFVLVPGAWQAGWCWERVVPLLEAAGHRVLAPHLLVGRKPEKARFAEALRENLVDHSPFFSQLKALAQALLEVSR